MSTPYSSLTRAERQAYDDAITSGAHWRRIELQILTLDGKLVQSFTPRVLNGQVTVDVEQNPTRVLTLSFVDESRALVFEPNSADAYPLHRKYLARVIDERYVAALQAWVAVTVFTGPFYDFERKGPEVDVTCHGMEALASGSVRKPRTWRRKTRKTDIIRGLLTEAGASANQLRIPDLPETTSVHVHVGVKGKGKHKHKVRTVRGFDVTHSNTYWGKAVALAASMNRHLYADAEGIFRLRSHPERPVYTFRAAALSDIDQQRPGYDGPNVWIVNGAKPKGSKRRVSSGPVGFPARHPLSAEQLAWHTKPFEVLEETQNPHAHSIAACRKIAIRKRDRAARVLAEYSLDALPIVWLREHDLVTVRTTWGNPTVQMRQWTIPLSPDSSPMTVGSKRRTRPAKAAKHHHGHQRISR